MSFIQTRHQWIRKLAGTSEQVAQLRLESDVADETLNVDAYNLANCDVHSALVSRSIENLLLRGASTARNARVLLKNLVEDQTYGSFAEIAAYGWLCRYPFDFFTQVDLGPTEVLGVNGSKLDGNIRFGNVYNVYFDVKAFGFNGHLARRLNEKLQQQFPNEEVLISESWDLSLEEFGDLIGTAEQIVSELRVKRFFRKGGLHIRLQERQPVTISMRTSDPYLLARQNSLFPFTDAKQFTRNCPFLLLFIVHPWFNSLTIHNDFAGRDTMFTRSLARRAFMEFSNDARLLGVTASARQVSQTTTLSDASQLLSAIFFLNVWPKEADPSIKYALPSWFYTNPRAVHPFPSYLLHVFRAQAQNPHAILIDDFANDNY